MPLRTCFLGAFNLNLITIKPVRLPVHIHLSNYYTKIYDVSYFFELSLKFCVFELKKTHFLFAH